MDSSLPVVCQFEDGWTFSKILEVFGKKCYIKRERYGWRVFKSFDQFVLFIHGDK